MRAMGTRPLILSAELVEVSKDCVSPSKGADVELGRRVRQRSLGVVAPVTVIAAATFNLRDHCLLDRVLRAMKVTKWSCIGKIWTLRTRNEAI